jgi:transcriptional regulator with XRE-family HTH domain
MLALSSEQIKAARAILNLSREGLAEESGLSVGTIRNLESGAVISLAYSEAIRKAVEKRGWEFTDSEGIRRRPNTGHILSGPDCADLVFNDMIRAVKETGTDIGVCIETQKKFILSLGHPEGDKLDRIEKLNAIANVKCILFEDADALLDFSNIEFRAAPKQFSCPFPYFIYGNKLTCVMEDHNNDFSFIVFPLPLKAWKGFDMTWDASVSFGGSSKMRRYNTSR